MERMKGRKKVRIESVAEYLSGDISYRKVAERYGIGAATLHQWVQEHKSGIGPEQEAIDRVVGLVETDEKLLPEEVGRLKRELREARLHNKLLEAMIDIAEEQMGVVIRKKSGAKR